MKLNVIISLMASLFFFGCTDKLDIQQAYEFSLSTMPVLTKLKKGETIEIRCQLNRVGNYIDALYYIGYFQSKRQRNFTG